jgi:hypothetical protein
MELVNAMTLRAVVAVCGVSESPWNGGLRAGSVTFGRAMAALQTA